MMKSAYSVISFAFILSFCNCNSKTPDVNISVYRALSSSLRQSNYEIEDQIKGLQKAIERETSDPRTSYHAKEWLAKAILIQTISNKIFQYLDSQKINLKIEAGYKQIDNVEYWDENDFKAVDNLFQKKGEGEKLKKRILDYEMKIFAIDTSMYSIFKKSVNQTIILTDNQHKEKAFAETFFGDIPAIAAFAVLHKFENDIRNFEIQLMTYCYNQIPR